MFLPWGAHTYARAAAVSSRAKSRHFSPDLFSIVVQLGAITPAIQNKKLKQRCLMSSDRLTVAASVLSQF
jgi:hypothetical protein